MTENNYLIYKHTSPSGKAYIGQTNNYNKRCYQHQTRTGCRAFHAAIKRYTWDAFTHEILYDDLSLEQANELEAKLIKEHNTLSPNGYNLRTGGLNSKLSEETRAKISAKIYAINKGKTYSEETRAKLSAAQKGKTLSPETRAKISDAGKGRIASAESITKRANTRRANIFTKIQTVYFTLTLTEKTYTHRTLAKLLGIGENTIPRHFNCYTITTSQIHDYLSQPNPYKQTT